MILMGCKSVKDLNRSKIDLEKLKMKIAKSVNRLGTEAVYNIFAKDKKISSKKGKNIIDLSLGQSDFKSPKHAVDAAIKALKDGHHGYTLTKWNN